MFLACGSTDLRKSIDGLAAIVQESFGLNPFSSAYSYSVTGHATSSKFYIGVTMGSGFTIAA
ncbi:transposase [Paenibacillus sp. A3M_27_13]|nr:transposase [Paenibacillus sp. A3M_27_13]